MLRYYNVMGRDVVCNYDPPPIQARQFDWHAVFKGYEPGDVMGWGETHAAAVENLKEQLES
jgi:hypothetical protein